MKCFNGNGFKETKRAIALLMTVLWLYGLLAGPLLAAPTGGVVTSGTAAIVQSGNTTNINQSTNKASINWQTFSIAPAETVNFNQPSIYAITLNRVVGNESSIIQGALNATGRVYLINSNGILFTKGSSVNTSGFLASTLNITDADFNAGNYVFNANGSLGSVVNQGTITANNGGYVALLGNTVSNQGVIAATKGTVALASGDQITLNFNGNSLLNLTIDQGALNALVENKQAIYADGGTVILTAKAADDLLSAQVNNSGLIQARTIDDLKGNIKLYADGGTVNVAGTLDASAPNGGDGGLIETSGNKVSIADSAIITTAAAYGKAGTWVIDPDGFTIAASGGDITGATLGSELAANNVTIASTQGSGNNGANDGNINVNDVVSWTTANTLSLTATNAINVNAAVTAPVGTLTLTAGTDVNINAPSSLQVATLGATAGNNVNINAPQTWANNGAWTFSGTNINVNDTVNWSAGTLTLNAGAAGGFINVNAVMTASANAQFVATYDTAMDTSMSGGSPTATYGTPFGGFNFLFQPATPATATTPPIAPTPWSFIGSLDFVNSTAATPVIINGNVYTLITSIGGSGPHDLSVINTNNGVGYYALASNLTAPSTAFTAPPISGMATGSIFEGLGNSISGVTVTANPALTPASFFGGNYGTIRDINLTKVTINSEAIGDGALIGVNNGTIINAYVSGTVNVIGSAVGTSFTGGEDIGGFAGINEGVIYGSRANVNVNATDAYAVGGFVGENVSEGSSHAVILNSASYGTVTIYETNYNAYTTTLNGGLGFGGFVGKNNGGVISNSLSDGAVIASSAAGSNIPFTSIGGFFGYNVNGNGSGIINNSVSYTTLSSTTTVPGDSSGAYSYGLSGSFGGYSFSGQVNNSSAFGNVSLTGTYASSYVDGFAGRNGSTTFNGNTFNPTTTGESTGVGRGSGTGVSTTTSTFGSSTQGPPESNAAQSAATAVANAQTLTQQATSQQTAVATAEAFAAQQEANFESNGQQTGGQASFSGQGSNSTGQGLNNQIGSFTPTNTGTVNGTMDNHIVYSDSGSYSATIKSINADGMQFDLEGGSQGGEGGAGGTNK